MHQNEETSTKQHATVRLTSAAISSNHLKLHRVHAVPATEPRAQKRTGLHCWPLLHQWRKPCKIIRYRFCTSLTIGDWRRIRSIVQVGPPSASQSKVVMSRYLFVVSPCLSSSVISQVPPILPAWLTCSSKIASKAVPRMMLASLSVSATTKSAPLAAQRRDLTEGVHSQEGW